MYYKTYPTDEQLDAAVRSGVIQEKYAIMVKDFRKFPRLSDKQNSCWKITCDKLQSGRPVRAAAVVDASPLEERVAELERKVAALLTQGAQPQ